MRSGPALDRDGSHTRADAGIDGRIETGVSQGAKVMLMSPLSRICRMSRFEIGIRILPPVVKLPAQTAPSPSCRGSGSVDTGRSWLSARIQPSNMLSRRLQTSPGEDARN